MDTYEKALNYIIESAPEYAKAKAERKHLEEFRKTLKARLYQECTEGTIADRESHAYAHADYEALLLGIKAAVEIEEELLWRMKAAEHKIECWRTQQANNRYIQGVTT